MCEKSGTVEQQKINNVFVEFRKVAERDRREGCACLVGMGEEGTASCLTGPPEARV